MSDQSSVPDLAAAAMSRAAGMLSPADGELIRSVTKRIWRDQGALVDAGSFIGATALSLIAGAYATGAPVPDGLVHCYDTFRISESYLADYFTQQEAGLPVPVEPPYRGSFRDLFDIQTARFAKLISLHAGDIAVEPVPAEIRVMVADICVTLRNNSIVLKRFAPQVLSGGAIVYREYLRVWHPWVPLTIHRLGDAVEPLDDEGLYARAFRVRRPISLKEAEAADPAALSNAECDRSFEQMIEQAAPGEAAWLQACQLRFKQIRGDFDDCVDHGRRLLNEAPDHAAAGEIADIIGRAERGSSF